MPGDPTFPRERDLCEQCGYPLRGLDPRANCPECGEPVMASHPDTRPGLSWQQALTFDAWARTSFQVLRRPAATFRAMSVGNRQPFRGLIFLLTYAAASAYLLFFWSATLGWDLFLQTGSPYMPPMELMLTVFTGIVGLSLIEAMGVTYFSQRRGWRVPWSLALRVVAYASPAWFPSTILLAVLQFAFLAIAPRLPLPHPAYVQPLTLIAHVILFAVAIMPFETLVWLGVRQVRFANPARYNHQPPGRTPNSSA